MKRILIVMYNHSVLQRRRLQLLEAIKSNYESESLVNYDKGGDSNE